MNRRDVRVEVKVSFTLDLGVDDTPLAWMDAAERITKEVFHQSFSRATLRVIETRFVAELHR